MISLKNLAKKYNYECCYCDKIIKKKNQLTREHFKNKSNEFGRNFKNILLSCKNCNFKMIKKTSSEKYNYLSNNAKKIVDNWRQKEKKYLKNINE